MASIIGVSANKALFAVGTRGFIVDTRTLDVSEHVLADVVDTETWVAPLDSDNAATWREIVDQTALTSRAVTASVAARQFTVPKRVADAAVRGLRGSRVSTISRAVAQQLTSSQQISGRTLAFIARYFDTAITAGGYNHSCWGGTAGQQWIDKTFNGVSDYDVDLTFDDDVIREFYENENNVDFAVEHQEPDVALALYRVTPSGWQTWVAGSWVACDEPTSDILGVDGETAAFVAGSLFDRPGQPVALREYDPDEWALFDAASEELDIELLDSLVAAGETDPQYTPEERSQNASKQPRDAMGRFATVGAVGSLKSGERVKVIGVDAANGTILVQDVNDATKAYSVPSKYLTIDPPNSQFPEGTPPPAQPKPITPLDLEGIIAQPRNVVGPKARLPKMLPPLGPQEIQQIIADYSGFIRREREQNASSLAALTPDTSDVKPLYLALVDRDDPQAVLDLVALVPASDTSDQPTTFKRSGGTWVPAPEVLQDLKGATPPPVVNLDADTYQNVLDQVDASDPGVTASALGRYVFSDSGEIIGFIAAGGLDRNRGGAEHLRRYWTVGKGGLKIRWGTPGDGTRCIKHLRKYLGVRAAGYCQLRHMEMTGQPMGQGPGERKSRH